MSARTKNDCQIPDPYSLSGSDLAHEYLKRINMAVVSPAPGFFAIATNATKELLIFGAERGVVRHASFDDDAALLPLKFAMLCEASFKVVGDVVTCDIDGVTATGRSYAEAAMRVILIVSPKRDVPSGQKGFTP